MPPRPTPGTDAYLTEELIDEPSEPCATACVRSATPRSCPSSTATGSGPSSRSSSCPSWRSWGSSGARSRATAALGSATSPLGSSARSSPAPTAASGPSSACSRGWPCSRFTRSAPRSSASAGCRAMAALDAIGAFALTEPDHGSDAVMLETSARRDGDSYVLHGAKRWIGNGSIADVIVVWARDEDGHVGGFLVEKGTAGPERAGDGGQDRAAGGVAGRARARRSPGPGREPPARLPQLQGRQPRAHPHALWRGLARARDGAGRLRGRRWPTPRRASSSAARWPPFSSCRTSSPGCWPRSPACSCCACG